MSTLYGMKDDVISVKAKALRYGWEKKISNLIILSRTFFSIVVILSLSRLRSACAPQPSPLVLNLELVLKGSGAHTYIQTVNERCYVRHKKVFVYFLASFLTFLTHCANDVNNMSSYSNFFFVQVLIIGGGPCGLRTAIEAQLLGAKVVVVEKRDRFSRNNVLHLWPFVIHDLRALGAKKFFGKFCAGSIDHISTK